MISILSSNIEDKLIKESFKQDKFSFRALGSSMLPFIRSGDLVTIKKVNIHYLSTGEILFFKRNDSFFLHRIIRKDIVGDELVYFTKGDNLPLFDLPVYPEDILGKLTTIKRNNKVINLDSTLNKNIGKLIAIFYPVTYPLTNFFIKSCRFIYKIFLHLNLTANRIKWVRYIKKYFNIEIEYKISSPKDSYLVSKFYNITEEEINHFMRDNAFYCFSKCNNKIKGALYVGQSWKEILSDDNWWIMSLDIIPKFRGFGIGENMVLKAISELKTRKINKVFVNIFESNKASLNLFKKIGFKDANVPELEEELNEYYSKVSQNSSKSIILCLEI